MNRIVNGRDVSLDFIRVLATLLVLNSHMDMCYSSCSYLATGGAMGDAFFFFISGYGLFLSSKKINFVDWYKKRLGRIYPTVLAMGLLACLVFRQENSFMEIMMVERYWFLKCILVSYLFIYPIWRYQLTLRVVIPLSILVMFVAFYLFYDFGSSNFYGEDCFFRWILFFTIILIGGATCLMSNRLQYRHWNWVALFACITIWYGMSFFVKGDLYVFSYFPLVGVCVFTYLVGKSPWIEKCFSHKILGNILFVIGGLCLESYLIQWFIITDKMNYLFPLNIPIIVMLVLISAYMLRIFSEMIRQIFSLEPFSWKRLLLYKR